MSDNLFQTLWKTLTPAEREKSRRGIEKPAYPLSAEEYYQKFLVAEVNKAARVINEYWHIIRAKNKAFNFDSKEVKADSLKSTIDKLMSLIRGEFVNVSNIKSNLSVISDKVSKVTSDSWKSFTKKATGVGLPFKRKSVNQMKTVWIDENTALIRSLQNDILKEVRVIISNGISAGDSTKTLSDKIFKTIAKNSAEHVGTIKKMKNRAKLIARDQISKLNGNIQARQQRDAGFTLYVWQTSADERVRKKHAVHDNLVFSWDSPPANGTGHPTEDYQCRCWSQALVAFGLTKKQISQCIGKTFSEVQALLKEWGE